MLDLSKLSDKNKKKINFSQFKLFSFLFLFFFFISLVSAQVVIGSTETDLKIDRNYAYKEEYNLRKGCIDSNKFCDATISCNITIMYPDSEVLFENVEMTRGNSFYNITVPASLNNRFGLYPSTMTCTNNTGKVGVDNFQIEITADGSPFDNVPTEIIVLFSGFILILVGKFRPELSLFKYLGSMIALIMGVLTIYPGYAHINYDTIIGQVVGFSSIGLGFWFLIEDSFSRSYQVDNYDQDDDGRFHGNG